MVGAFGVEEKMSLLPISMISPKYSGLLVHLLLLGWYSWVSVKFTKFTSSLYWGNQPRVTHHNSKSCLTAIIVM